MKNSPLFLCLAMLIACGSTEDQTVTNLESTQNSNQSEVMNTPELEPAQVVQRQDDNYQKPGANVRFSHDFDGVAEPAQIEIFTLRVVPAYFTGNLDIALSTSDGLELLVPSEHRFALGGGALEVPVQVRASAPGTYRLRALAQLDMGSMMNSMRSYSMTVQVGADFAEAAVAEKATSADVDTTPEGEKVIRSSAEETIY